MNLKELTWENHKNAERQKFAKILMSGEIDPKLYYKYLLNQLRAYHTLETALDELEYCTLLGEGRKEVEALLDIKRWKWILGDASEMSEKFYYQGVEFPAPTVLLAFDEKRHFGFNEEKQKYESTYTHEKFMYGWITPSTYDYIEHVEKLRANNDLNGLLAHMYVRHFGDMYGGAMIAKRVPTKGRMYSFENKEESKAALRSLLNDDMADEANRCFEFAIRLFEELGNE